MHYSTAEGVTAERSGLRMVVLDPEGKVLTTLSPVGALVWSRLPADFATVLANLTDTFVDVDTSILTEDLRAFFAELGDVGLVVATDAPR